MESGQTNDSYAEFDANKHCVAVMATNHDLTAEQVKGIKTALEEILVNALLDPATADYMATVGFRGNPQFSKGVLKLWYEDDVALQWLRSAVENIPSPVFGSTLVVRSLGEAG